jgi:hypothetical protein
MAWAQTAPDSMELTADALIRLHDELTVRWHRQNPAVAGTDFARLAAENHLRNFQIWHEEDIARRDDLGAESVRAAKRAIDRNNQERNDFIEQIDLHLSARLAPVEGAPLHSETPGMMIDRLSILALKEFHMAEEVARPDASAMHRRACAEKLARLRLQRQDLAACLTALLADLQAGRRSFRLYRQFKMYNDPELNPQLYRNVAKT